MDLPGNYGEVTPGIPILDQPFPGDLGKPILARQRLLDAGGSICWMTPPCRPR